MCSSLAGPQQPHASPSAEEKLSLKHHLNRKLKEFCATGPLIVGNVVIVSGNNTVANQCHVTF